MSLRRRIAAAAAAAVAAVAVAVALTGYFTTRSHLIGEVKSQLVQRAQPMLEPHPRNHPGAGQNEHPGSGQNEHPSFDFPGPPQPGGAAGLWQVVTPGGKIYPGTNVTLPVTQAVRSIANNGAGSTFFAAHVDGVHYMIYAAWDAPDNHVVMVALPLTDTDAVLSGLLLPYGLLIAGGIVLAALLGLAISRSALRPIDRFVARTERVTRELDRPARLEGADALELRRLAASFNQTLDALERSIESQRNLIADASHELRTPIAALRSDIQIFLEADRLPAGEREALQASILAELDELTQVVADILELARGSAPNVRVEPVELDTLVREAVERTQRRAPQLQFDLNIDLTVVSGVAERVSRAVTNVIDNARKWSPPAGTIDVQLHQGILTVRDHGPGFADKDLPHVFDRFYRANQARRMPGSGLGLAIVKQTAEAHGGWVDAGNATDGGAVVTVSFGTPIKDGSPAEAATASDLG